VQGGKEEKYAGLGKIKVGTLPWEKGSPANRAANREKNVFVKGEKRSGLEGERFYALEVRSSYQETPWKKNTSSRGGTKKRLLLTFE